MALEARLTGEDPPVKLEEARPLRVLPLDNTQAHALTCSKKRGSIGHHFRVLGDGSDSLQPDLDATLDALRRFEWVGITYVEWSRCRRRRRRRREGGGGELCGGDPSSWCHPRKISSRLFLDFSIFKFDIPDLHRDLMEPSLCLLHYQANGSLPAVCECGSDARRDAAHPLGHWHETRSQRRCGNFDIILDHF